jgi:hypothetical protein
MSNHSYQKAFNDLILPKIRAAFPQSKIVNHCKQGDEYRVGFLRKTTEPRSGIIQSWMIINHEAVLINNN